jgi:malonyl CoA-acyl carrier protein transacylase
MTILTPSPPSSPNDPAYWQAVDTANRAHDFIESSQYRGAILELEAQRVAYLKRQAEAAEKAATLSQQQRDLIVAQNILIKDLFATMARPVSESDRLQSIAVALIAAGVSPIAAWAQAKQSLAARAFIEGGSNA